MRRVARWLGCLALAAVSASAAGLEIAIYNVENYVAADRLTDAGYRKDYPKPETAKSALRTVIRELDADVLVLQEMGPRPYLEELQRDLATQFTKPAEDKFAGVTWTRGLGDAPLLADTVASFQCRTAARYYGGDHVIFLGAVEAYAYNHAEPLLFARGGFGQFTPGP